ncbi:DNA-processing protein DprA [Cellulomonas sp. SG140]|uniref:DNA-processing protein DprA n=1 Tax=Cellulomonas sp. SG140 TaxID=2976536 RepID=UPI0021E6F8D0|nr:DNA-processing protein DprA [Cellulomonas sp. SG140]
MLHAAGEEMGAADRARLGRALLRWAARLDSVCPERDLGALQRLGGHLVVPGDDEWPRGLDDLGDAAPPALWVRGGLSARSTVAVVGARASTTYGERVAYDLAHGLASRGSCVASGGAYGIDAAAHRGALGAGGPTLVVLAGGVDRAYPAGNARIFEEAVGTGGALVSEVPPGSLPTKSRFLQRNRLIAALSDATVVVEAAWRSGALSSAHHAAALLRPVGAVPGPVTSAASAGCHWLLREGHAVCVTDADEVAELLPGALHHTVDVRTRDDAAVQGTLSDLGTRVVQVHDALPMRGGLDESTIAARAGTSVAEARAALGVLQLEGLAVREGDRWTVRRAARATDTRPTG